MNREQALRHFTNRAPDKRKLAKELYLTKRGEVVSLEHYGTTLIQWYSSHLHVYAHPSKTSYKHLDSYLPSGYRMCTGFRSGVTVIRTPAGRFPLDGSRNFDLQGVPLDWTYPGIDAKELFDKTRTFIQELLRDFYFRRLLSPPLCEACLAVGKGRMSAEGVLLHVQGDRRCPQLIRQALQQHSRYNTMELVEPFFLPKPKPPHIPLRERLIEKARRDLTNEAVTKPPRYPGRDTVGNVLHAHLLSPFGFSNQTHVYDSKRIWIWG